MEEIDLGSDVLGSHPCVQRAVSVANSSTPPIDIHLGLLDAALAPSDLVRG